MTIDQRDEIVSRLKLAILEFKSVKVSTYYAQVMKLGGLNSSDQSELERVKAAITEDGRYIENKDINQQGKFFDYYISLNPNYEVNQSLLAANKSLIITNDSLVETNRAAKELYETTLPDNF